MVVSDMYIVFDDHVDPFLLAFNSYDDALEEYNNRKQDEYKIKTYIAKVLDISIK
ncbi:hypothetical protein [Oceanobacillus kimchii]|uniref:hypothetical protein n=1 Tax=Oceanobacillus kimchii TaxID=746691 RepID=UPI003C74A95C